MFPLDRRGRSVRGDDGGGNGRERHRRAGDRHPQRGRDRPGPADRPAEVLSGTRRDPSRRRGASRGQRSHRDRLPGGHGRDHRLELGADRVPRTVGSGGDHRALRPRLDRGGRRHRRTVDLGPGDRRTMHRPVSGRGGQRRRGDRRGRRRSTSPSPPVGSRWAPSATRRCTPPAVGWSSASPARASVDVQHVVGPGVGHRPSWRRTGAPSRQPLGSRAVRRGVRERWPHGGRVASAGRSR